MLSFLELSIDILERETILINCKVC